ncbi:FAD-dependent oxidoreductase [Pseudooceanicola sp. CBS1P-1]|uniref:FAD-dependent oxidoreductase n=1 Tax=Pseudooceanicola albus TaxID=2692189 RepID=A0A6L7G6I9_9RHOB|nr:MULTISPECIES: FAD-dependent oxidoreductase [Pseudooceanicola]MBT9385661.1 FAD-dependent oxidoreductase [Pseudooceanicola endophyticus]MXN18930.1 FAD-dependent oxidoreductase [Pseudooceanicola albus]
MGDIQIDSLAAQYDVAVIGSGAAGLSAAIFAALEGARVLLVERTDFIGGTSALSGGTVWAPGTRTGAQVNAGDSRADVSAFLDSAVGNFGDKAMREAFLDAAPEAIATLEDRTQVAFRPYPKHPDYEWDHPHPTLNGRAIEPVPFDTRAMGRTRDMIRPPIPEFTVLGGMNIDRVDIGHLLNRYKSLPAFLHVAKIVSRYMRDRAVYGRHTRLVMGAALVGRLLASALDLGVDILRGAEVTALSQSGGDVTGITLTCEGQTRQVATPGGVILATGGFGRSKARRAAYLPAALRGESPSAPGHTGTLHDLAEGLGAVYGSGNDQSAFWAPCSIRKRADGSTAVFPHFVLDRSKPGTVCVDLRGRRFVNETISYHAFGKAMLEGGPDTAGAWIITDAPTLAKFGLGMVHPGGENPKPHVEEGYLIEAHSLAELAAKTGTDPDALAASVAQINAAAQLGRDEAWGRGGSPYQCNNGDPSVSPNPTLGPIATAPFYAVRLQPADIGTARGFRSDTAARLLRADGSVIGGLYAVGNDLHSIMGGTYPGPGITLGPGLVFGAIAGRHAAARSREEKGQHRAA